MPTNRIVLIAMIDPATRANYEGMCRTLGYQVLTVSSVEQARLRQSHMKARIVISDWDVQTRMGPDFCQSIRQNKLGT